MQKLLLCLLCLTLAGCGDFSMSVTESGTTEKNLTAIQQEIADCKSIGKTYQLRLFSMHRNVAIQEERDTLGYSVTCITRSK